MIISMLYTITPLPLNSTKRIEKNMRLTIDREWDKIIAMQAPNKPY